MIKSVIFSLACTCWVAPYAAFAAPYAAFADEAKPTEAKPTGTEQKNAERRTRIDWAEIKLSGSYPEHQQMPGLFGELVEGLSTCMERLHQAARDKSIKGVILHIDGVEIGWARLNELQSAIAEVKAAGKPIWARMNDGGNKDYLLAAACDRILMPESGTLMLTGLRAEVMFYKNLFEMFDVKADMLRVGRLQVGSGTLYAIGNESRVSSGNGRNSRRLLCDDGQPDCCGAKAIGRKRQSLYRRRSAFPCSRPRSWG